jgi:hypothetical protein
MDELSVVILESATKSIPELLNNSTLVSKQAAVLVAGFNDQGRALTVTLDDCVNVNLKKSASVFRSMIPESAKAFDTIFNVVAAAMVFPWSSLR